MQRTPSREQRETRNEKRAGENCMNALRVLILDDERKIADKVSTYLMKQGYNAQSAYFPTQAFKILNRDPIDILISDVLMP